ncbi:MAG TPA: sensor histidine kinase [Acidobacteriaceae bacterium]|nr:sensor histidine kinase [Acidobacteriaceae bacterium]
MSPQCNLRWNFTTWVSDLIRGDAQEGWRDTSMEPPLRGWRRWFDYDHSIWLLFLGFWFLQPYLNHEPPVHFLWLGLALATFVPAYLLAHFAPRKTRPIWVGVMFLVALVYVPVNQSTWGAYIYIAASLPEVTESTNTVIGLLLLECGIMAVQSWWFHFSAWTWALSIGLTLLIGMNRLRMEQKHRADARLRLAHEEIEHLAKTAERERIARDMHDVLGHSLSLVVLKSELARRLLATQPARAALEIAEIETAARHALAEVRKTITGYRSEGFASEINRAARVLETAGVRVTKPVIAPDLAPRHEATLSLVLREAVTNIVRHAGASECSIEFSAAPDRTKLVIADDGKGDIREEGNGLRGMRERVQELGGSLSLESHRGTRLQIELPEFSANAGSGES